MFQQDVRLIMVGSPSCPSTVCRHVTCWIVVNHDVWVIHNPPTAGSDRKAHVDLETVWDFIHELQVDRRRQLATIAHVAALQEVDISRSRGDLVVIAEESSNPAHPTDGAYVSFQAAAANPDHVSAPHCPNSRVFVPTLDAL